jgi:hypothetical protein
MKYWDNPIIIGERERYWRTAKAYFLQYLQFIGGKKIDRGAVSMKYLRHHLIVTTVLVMPIRNCTSNEG